MWWAIIFGLQQTAVLNYAVFVILLVLTERNDKSPVIIMTAFSVVQDIILEVHLI